MQLDELQVYQLAMQLAEDIWNIAVKWNYLAQDTIGKQLIRSSDSVAANISEGYGRFFYKENRQFCYYSRGSLYETKTWLTKALSRNLIDPVLYDQLSTTIDTLSIKLNNYIKSIGPRDKGSR